MNILLVANNPTDVKIINSELVQATGPPYSLEHVETLSAGLERLQCGGVDVLLVDLNLPDSEGIETYRRLRQQAPSMPIIVLTVDEQDPSAQMAIAEGAQKVLTKGQVPGCQLLRRIGEVTHRHRRGRAQPLSPRR